MGYIEITKEDISLQKKLLCQCQSALSNLPKGRLARKNIKGKSYYYLVDSEGRQIYIRKENKKLIYNLRYRRLLEETIKRMSANIKAQSVLLNCYAPYDPVSVQKSLPMTYRDINLKRDSDAPAEPVPKGQAYYPEGLIYPTSFGMYLRSKSEVLIAELLHASKIPFQYEPNLRLQSVDGFWYNCHPDFRIIPEVGRDIYWEHAGMMNNASHRENLYRKITDYHHNNIVIPTNLIITMDGPDGIIDTAAINRIINGQLLPLFRR